MTKQLTVKNLSRAQLRGFTIVPLLTPATADGRIDEPALGRLVEHIIAGGCQGLMVCGTTGEFASLTIAQRVHLVQLAIAAARGRVVIFAGIGDTCPEHSLTLAREFFAAGADAVVGNLPSYFPLTPEMMEHYFARQADSVTGPMYLYNIPQTTRQSIPLDVVELCRMFAERGDFAVFCGSVAMTSKAMRAGADGFVPGGGNFEPALMCTLMKQLVAGDAAADATQQRIDEINAVYQKGRTISQLFASLKAVMEIRGLCSREVFPPLLRATDEEVQQIRGQLQELGALS